VLAAVVEPGLVRASGTAVCGSSANAAKGMLTKAKAIKLVLNRAKGFVLNLFASLAKFCH